MTLDRDGAQMCEVLLYDCLKSGDGCTVRLLLSRLDITS